MESEFVFDDLSEYKKELLKETKKHFPEETKKFLERATRKLTIVTKRNAKMLVDKRDGLYHKEFETGKIYDRNGTFYCKSFNKAPHAHLIELGHFQVARGESRKKGVMRRSGKDGPHIGWTNGKHVFEKSSIEYKQQFYKDIEDYLFDEISMEKKR